MTVKWRPKSRSTTAPPNVMKLQYYLDHPRSAAGASLVVYCREFPYGRTHEQVLAAVGRYVPPPRQAEKWAYGTVDGGMRALRRAGIIVRAGKQHGRDRPDGTWASFVLSDWAIKYLREVGELT